MNLPWFHVESVPEPGEQCRLDRGELRHLRSARRVTDGQTVVVFDGSGVVAEARVEPDRASSFWTIRITDRSTHVRPPHEVHLISALPKGDRTPTMLSMATQLGMNSFRALRSDRTVVTQGTGAAERWRRIMVEACKQSHRPWIPEILDPIDVPGVAELAANAQGTVRVAHPGGEPSTGTADQSRLQCTLVVIGPEGGFTDEEIGQLTGGGADLVDLGPGILRIETAAVAMLTLAASEQRATGSRTIAARNSQ